MKVLFTWLRASRLPSQSYIFMPILAGQALYAMTGGTFSWTLFAVLQGYGLLMQLYIVYANDFADVETDRLNRTYTMFSGGSRVLVAGELSHRAVGIGALVAAVLTLTTGVILALFFDRPWAPLLILAGIALLWMYSYPPVKMSYRGGGELLQMLGVGVVLPIMGYYGQAGTLAGFPIEIFGIILPTQLACAMATSLPDAQSDRESDKRTSTVQFGMTVNRGMITVLNGITCAGLLLWRQMEITRLPHAIPWGLLLLILLVLGYLLFRVPVGPRALFLFVLLCILFTVGSTGFLAHLAWSGGTGT